MEWLLLSILIGFPLLALAAGAAYVYSDALDHDMEPRKWAALAFFVPFFGFFAYLFERDEQNLDTSDREEMFTDGPFQIHKSRAQETPLARTEDEDGAEDTYRDDS
ncbi:hypothetical protein ACFQJ7_14675 [Halovenus rubra]|uniref:Uncharacterized protein n=2 Tax=Halovenus rubra TaxID=869890 RepID=A0ACC7DXY5_9EURY|nr:hypothetical protein [Halovenus rubra]